MTSATTTNILFGRPDTILGICEGAGRDLGVNPNLLRAALGLALLFQPLAVIAAYLGLGVLVFATRMLFPAPRAAAVVAAEAPAVSADNDVETRELALAA